MEEGEVFECDNGYAYRVKDGVLQDNDPQFVDYEGGWRVARLSYNEAGKYEFFTPLFISDKAKELAKIEEEETSSGAQIPCAACKTMRKHCAQRDMDCPFQNTAYGMQVLLNWLAGHGVEVSSC